MFLQGFPLTHEVADFPHQRLMPVDHRLRGIRIVVEPGRRDDRLELLDLRFPVGNPGFQFRDPLVQRIGGTLLFLSLSVELFPLVTGRC